MSTPTTEQAERIERTRLMRVERLMPRAAELVAKHAEGAAAITVAHVAAILDDALQEQRREHNREMHEAEREFSREARDIAAESRWQSSQGDEYGAY
ncbi:hypothetical protein J7E70_01960 [Variovorax paradoxus]|nr:hypothetical protein [Variovorax paradoxus]MBT2299219.1 hypothetical protein [Variovorax paradoxus]